MKILIIEDNISVLNALQQGFKYKHVITDQALDGSEGLKMLNDHFYDLAIIDLYLPGVDGEKIIKKARELGIKTPILVLTASKDIDTKTRLLEAGVDDYVEKPYSFEELFARITAILRRSKQNFPSEYLKIEDLELLPDKRIAVRAGKKIPLRGKEYELLKYFMNHPNTVVNRQTLMEKVWGYSTSVLSNTVDAHVSNLRQKIDKGFRKTLIKTIHGIGYMMTTEG